MTTASARSSSAAQARRAHDVYARAAREAAKAMAALMGANVTCDALRTARIESVLEGMPDHSCATSFALSGGTAGTLVVAADVDDAAALAARLLRNPPALPLNARARGAFDEVGNIVASQFLNAVAAVLGVSCLPSVPYAHTGDGEELIASIADVHARMTHDETVTAQFVVEGGARLILVHAPAAGVNEEIAARDVAR